MTVRQIYKGPRRKFVSFWRLTRPRSLIYAVITFPVYLLALVTPKKKHQIYGSFNGQIIGDNSYYAIKAVNESSPSIYFISKSHEAIAASGLKEKAVYAYSPRGLWLQLTASKAHFSHTIDDFFAPSIMGATVVALSHGVSTKKTAASDKKLSWIMNPLIKRVILLFFPYLYHAYCNEVHSPSPFFDRYKLQSYGFTQPKLVRAPMPRIQVFDRSSSSAGKILFAPTYRKNQGLAQTLVNAGLYSDELQYVLETYGKELWIKAHYMDEAEIAEVNLPFGSQWLRESSLNEHLMNFSSLITDYSSAFYDAHIAGLAIGFINHDLDQFITTESELYDWFQNLVANHGEKSLSAAITKVSTQGGINLDFLFG